MDPATITISYIANVIEVASAFLRRSGHNKTVEDAYCRLILRISKQDDLSPVAHSYLANLDNLYLFKLDDEELIKILSGHKSIIKDKQVVEAADQLLTVVEAESERIYGRANEQMEQAYKLHLVQAKKWSRLSILVIILGFLLIVAGIATVYLVNISTGLTVTIAGIIINLTSALFFRQAADATKQANNKVQKLLELERTRSFVQALTATRVDTEFPEKNHELADA